MSSSSQPPSVSLHELSLVAAAAAIKDGSISSSEYATALLKRARKHADLMAFITLDEVAILEGACRADLERKSGKSGGLLHGLPVAVKDSYSTRDMPTSVGTKVLAGFRPGRDADVVKSLRDSGAIIFGKNNLVEMSYGLTGLNAHYGQVKNPYDRSRVTGGSSSGAGASVAARLVPAALGGDTVGSIRVPAPLCGIVGFRPSTGRWSGRGIAPISNTLDTPGPMARTVEDCALLDAVATGEKFFSNPVAAGLKDLRFGFAPRQHLDLIDPEVEAQFRKTLTLLRDAGAQVVEIDLGDDFAALVTRSNWPVMFSETMPHVNEFLAENRLKITFDEIYEGLGENVKAVWRDVVMPSGAGFISKEAYEAAMIVHRPELRDRLAAAYCEHGIDSLLFPTTPTVAPLTDEQASFTIAGQAVTRTVLARNVVASSCVGMPGISLPIGLSSAGLPIGMEMDAVRGRDLDLLAAAARVSAAIGAIAAPNID
jgi:mandelamide amidase